MKTSLIAACLLVLTAGSCCAQDTNAQLKALSKRIEVLKRKEALLDAVVGVRSAPVKICREAGWPDTDECRLEALAVMRTLQSHYDSFVVKGEAAK